MRLATFNIYWLGGDKIERGAADYERLARVIAKVNADVFVFEEIVDPDVLREVLDRADELTGRSYTMHDAQNRLLGSGGAQDQKVVAAYDARAYDLLAASAIYGGVNRLPFGLRLRRKADGARALVVGVHFQSGFPVFEDVKDAGTRRKQCQHLSDWVDGKKAVENPALPGPEAGEHVVVLGDFNALYESDDPALGVVVQSLEPLRRMKDEGGWWWRKPLADPSGGDRTSSYIEGWLIDHVMLSPSLAGRIERRPTLYAFDRDPDFFPAPADVQAYYRLSDHRPVFVDVSLAP